MIFLISDGMLLLFFGIIFIAGFGTALSVIEWFLSYWWILAILSAVFAVVKLLFSDLKESFVFFICDIFKYSAAYYSLFRYATNCMNAFNSGGLSGILEFVIEVFFCGIAVVGLLGYGTSLCFQAVEDKYTDVGKYVTGSMMSVFCALIFLAEQIGLL